MNFDSRLFWRGVICCFFMSIAIGLSALSFFEGMMGEMMIAAAFIWFWCWVLLTDIFSLDVSVQTWSVVGCIVLTCFSWAFIYERVIWLFRKIKRPREA